MLVFCARDTVCMRTSDLSHLVRLGLSAELHRHVREIEAEALNLCQAGTSLDAVYHT